MTDLRADLFVVRGKHFAFSNYQAKPNGTHMVLPLEKMFSLTDQRFIVPISCYSNFILNDTVSKEPIDKVSRDYVAVGVIAHSICNHSISEYVAGGNETGSLSVLQDRWSMNSAFCRSKSYILESAANAGLHIYNDVATIYKEAYKACGHSNPPFYVGHISTVTEVMSILNKEVELRIKDLLDEQEAIEKQIVNGLAEKHKALTAKRLDQIKTDCEVIQGKFLKLMEEFPKTFGLKVYDAV